MNQGHPTEYLGDESKRIVKHVPRLYCVRCRIAYLSKILRKKVVVARLEPDLFGEAVAGVKVCILVVTPETYSTPLVA